MRRQLFAAMLDSVDVGLVGCDATGALVFNNRAERALFSLPRAYDGLPMAELDDRIDVLAADGTRLEPAQYPLMRALRGEDTSVVEVVAGPAGGPHREIVVRARQIRAADGTVLGAVAALTDVSAERASERALREAQGALLHAARHDHLTGLPNRALLVERLEESLARARRSQRDVAVLFCDLDGFKAVNDGGGHSAGDRVLVTIAQRMAGVLRDGDLVARVGGDEFVVVLEAWQPGPESPDAFAADGVQTLAQRVAGRLSEVASRPVSVDGKHFSVSVSVGIACTSYGPGGTAEPGGSAARAADWLLNRADRAMYEAKASVSQIPAPRGAPWPREDASLSDR